MVKALAQDAGNHRVVDIMRQDCPTVEVDEPLDRALDTMNSRGCATLLVLRSGELVGILSEEHLGRWLMLHSSVRKRSSEPSPPAVMKPRKTETPVHF